MRTSTTEIANAILTRKDGPIPRFPTASSKPFVVTSLSTKRYAPSKKIPVQKLATIPPGTSTKARLSVPREDSTRQASRPGSLPGVVQKADPRRPSAKPMPVAAPNNTREVRRSTLLPVVPAAHQSLAEKRFVPKPLKIAERLKEGELMGEHPTAGSATRRSTQVTTSNKCPLRPGCVPRGRIYLSSCGVSQAKGKQDATAKRFSIGPRNPVFAFRKSSADIGISGTAGRFKATDASMKKPVVAVGCRTRTQTRNWRLTVPKAITYPQVIKPSFDVAWSPPASPDLSSFPSQSWTIVVDVNVKRLKTPPTICGDGTLSSMRDVSKSDVAETPKDSCGGSISKSISTSPALSSPTIVQTSASPTNTLVGSDSVADISNPTKVSFPKVSRTARAGTFISPLMNSATSITALAKVMGSQLSSRTWVFESINRIRTTVQRAIKIARNFFSPLRRASQSDPEIASAKAMGTNAPRIRRLFIPPLDKDAKVSRDATTQMEIQMLRARKVAGGGVVDPRLDRLGSFSAMAILTKLWTPRSDGPSQV